MIDLIVEDKFETNKGTVFTGSLSRNGLENSEILIGQEFIHDNLLYEITEVERFRKTFGNLIGDNFGILVKLKENGE